ncbi:hypothetical protein V1517DRAFT_128345 [Lipomyces orientalis]|uniref:Uncharacterized protein n=1 Tax=Lipomyces orientalis TaxID=1233043 RepID=A0ACC3TY51_9ASCO
MVKVGVKCGFWAYVYVICRINMFSFNFCFGLDINSLISVCGYECNCGREETHCHLSQSWYRALICFYCIFSASLLILLAANVRTRA